MKTAANRPAIIQILLHDGTYEALQQRVGQFIQEIRAEVDDARDGDGDNAGAGGEDAPVEVTEPHPHQPQRQEASCNCETGVATWPMDGHCLVTNAQYPYMASEPAS